MVTSLTGIADLLSNEKLEVPVFQRAYKWDAQHVRDLYQDVSNAIAESEAEYFLGSIVASEQGGEGDRLHIVDGQQRLATTSILIAAMRDYFKRQGDDERASDIDQEYLVTKDIWSQEREPRLRLSDSDNDYFQKRILAQVGTQQRENAAPIRDSHQRLDRAAEIAREHIKSLVSVDSSPTSRLRDLLEYLESNAKVIWVRVPDHANAFVIFETLNDRGLDLAISDLLKNYLFLTAQDRLEEVRTQWLEMFATLEAVGEENSAVDYIRHLWSSEHGATRESNLYDSIKNGVNSKQAAVDFAQKLARGAKSYAALLNTDHPAWEKYGDTVREHMGTINMLRMKQIRPLLLAILDEFSVSEVRKTLDLMVSWGVRFLIAGGLGGGTMEKRYSQAAIKVRDGEISDAKDLHTEMADVVPNDSQFRAAFATDTQSYAYLARYYLRVLEKQARGEEQPELVPNRNKEEVNLEHVLPKNPSAEWSHINPEIAKAFSRRYGNLCLLKERINNKIANDGFNEKRPHLSKSEFVLTEKIGEKKEWDIDQIEERQEWMADLAVEAWDVDVA